MYPVSVISTILIRWILVQWENNIFDYSADIAKVSQINRSKEKQLAEKYPPIYLKPYAELETPAVVIDNAGHLIAWHLPGILTTSRQNAVWESNKHLQSVLRSYRPTLKYSSWRNAFRLYKSVGDCPQSFPASVNISPAWFDQGSEVGTKNENINTMINFL